MITWDLYRKIHPQASERTLVWVGQVSTAVLVALGLLWIPMIRLISGQLYQYLQSVQAYISPPIAAVFLLGIFWRRVNAQGAVASLATGFVIGIGRLVAELNKSALESGPLLFFAEINFLHFAVVLFVICAAVLIIVSLLTPPPDPDQIAGLTLQSADQRPPAGEAEVRALPDLASDPSWRRTDRLLSALAIIGVGAIWYYFRG